MPIFIIPHRQRIWQAIASAYRPPNNPFALYAEDERIGKYHAGTLGINFQSGVNTLSLHNAWLTGYWPGGYPLRIPSEGRAASFPDMISPWTAASGMGYSIIPNTEPLVPPVVVRHGDVPAWVQAYFNYLQNQVDIYGVVVRRERRPEVAR